MPDTLRWLRYYWADEEITFYFEVEADGWVRRQVELEGPDGKPVAVAANDRNGPDLDTRAVLPAPEWEGDEPVVLTAEEFQAVWVAARARLEADHG